MTIRPLSFYDALSHDRCARDSYRRLSPEGKSALLSRAMRAGNAEEMRLYVLSLRTREDAHETF